MADPATANDALADLYRRFTRHAVEVEDEGGGFTARLIQLTADKADPTVVVSGRTLKTARGDSRAAALAELVKVAK